MAGTSDTRNLRLYVMDSWSSYYIQTIQDWRETLKARTIQKEYEGRTVTYMELPAKGKSTLKEFVLKTSENTITLKIRTFDLYIVGYKNTNNEWFEFKPQTDPITPDSTPLRYPGSYDQNGAGVERVQIDFCEERLKKAINDLGVAEQIEGNEQRRADAVLVIVTMIPEALRFQRILTLVQNEPGTDKRWIVDLTHNWQSLSKRIRDASNHLCPKFKTYTIENSGAIKIETIEEACELVRLVKYEDEGSDKNMDVKQKPEKSTASKGKKQNPKKSTASKGKKIQLS